MQSKKIILFLLLALAVQDSYAQQESPQWIIPITEEIIKETDLCERCTWLPPTFTRIEFNNDDYYFLRYGCSIADNFARMYDKEGELVGECMTVNGDSDCDFGFNAFSIYTLAEVIVPIWSCETGFDCDFARANNVDQYVPITIDDSRCVEGIKILKVSEEYLTYQWSGPDVTSTSSMIEITQGGNYQVVVTDMDGCPITGTVFIPDIDVLDVSIKGPDMVCQNGTVNLLTTTFDSYQWSTGSTIASTTISEAGIYNVTVTNEQNCQGIASFMVEEYPFLETTIEIETTKVKEGEEVLVELQTASGEVTLLEQEWTGNGLFSCDDCTSATFRPFESGLIEVATIDSRGCTNTIQQLIEVEELPLEIYVPNIFAPKGSGLNTTFTIFSGTNVLEIKELVIFDRWGNLVFRNTDFAPNQAHTGWDGKMKGELVAQDVYVFMAEVLFSNGKSKTFSGDILVIY